MLAYPGIVDEHWTVHEPPVISSIMVHGLRCSAGRIVAEEPHLRSVGIEPGLDVRGEVVASVNNHPDVRRVQPTSYDEVPEAAILERRRPTRS